VCGRDPQKTESGAAAPNHEGKTLKRGKKLTTALQQAGARRGASQRKQPAADRAAAGLLETVLASLADSKAENPVTIDIRGKSSLADYMVVASGRSQRHVAAAAEHLVQALKSGGIRPRVEGLPHCDWVLVDAGDIVVHIFRPEVREFYGLEKMWSATERPN